MIYRNYQTGIIITVMLIGLLSGCSPPQSSTDYVARVGPQYLTREELESSRIALSSGLDSTVAAQQLVERWITNEVLYREAVRRGLPSDPGIRSQLRESERSILVNSLMEKLLNEENTAITEGQLSSYYDKHRTQLAISEPYVRIRYTVVSSADSAKVVLKAMRELNTATNPDSVWTVLSSGFGAETEPMTSLADSFFPLGEVSESIPGLGERLSTKNRGDVIGPFESNGRYHVIQLVDRLEAGSIPEFEMIRDFLQSSVMIEARKQILARQVQRLRNEAIAREELQIR